MNFLSRVRIPRNLLFFIKAISKQIHHEITNHLIKIEIVDNETYLEIVKCHENKYGGGL